MNHIFASCYSMLFCPKKSSVKKSNPNKKRDLEDMLIAESLSECCWKLIQLELVVASGIVKDRKDGRIKVELEFLLSSEQSEQDIKETIFKLCPELACHDGGILKLVFHKAETYIYPRFVHT